MRPNGLVSWMLPAERYRNPYGDAIGPLEDFSRIFCVARSPLAAINSIIPENADTASYSFRTRILRNRFEIILPTEAEDPDGIQSAVMSYTLWYELCMSFLPQLIYRVDRPEDDALLADYVGRSVRRSDEIGRNSRPKRRATHFTPDALDSLPHDWLLRFAEMAEGLGYPDDAAMIEKSAAGRAAG